MMKYLSVLFLLLAGSVFATENLLRNPNFEAAPGTLPEQWGISSGSTVHFQVRDAVATIEAPADGLAVTQQNLSLQPQTRYRLEYEVRNLPGKTGKIHSYCEWSTLTDGGDLWGGFYPGTATASGDWQRYEYAFQTPMAEFGATRPYLALKIEGNIQLRHLLLASDKREAGAIANGDFSEGPRYWQLTGDAKIQDRQLQLRVNDVEAATATQKGIMLLPGREYQLECRVTGTPAPGATATGYLPWSLVVNWPGTGQVNRFDEDLLPGLATKRTMRFSTPWKEVMDGMTLQLTLATPGLLSLEELTLSLLPLPEVPPIQCYFSNLGPRQAVYLSQKLSQLEGVLEYADGIEQCDLHWYDSKGNLIWNDAVGADGVFQLPLTHPQPGMTRLEFRTQDTTITLNLPIYAEVEQEVRIDADNILRINGQPFLPIYLFDFSSLQLPETLYYMARAGFNTIIGGQHGDLDLCHEYGFKVVLWPGVPPDTNPATLAAYRENFQNKHAEAQKHPAFLGYFLEDEPAWGGKPLNNLLAAYDIIRELDPYHPVWINEAPRGSMELISAYGRACDIYGVDIYPVPPPHPHSGLDNKELSCVGDYARRMRESVQDRKPVWMCLQGFAWNTLNSQPDPIYPSDEQLRFMYFDSMVNGARGLGLWGGGSIDQLDFFEVLRRTALEQQQLSGLWYLPESPDWVVSSDAPEIALFARQHQGHHYLVAVNRAIESVDTTIRLGRELQLQEWRNTDSLLPSGVEFSAVFAPNQVRVYTDGALPEPVNELTPFNPELERDRCPMLDDSIFWQTDAAWIWRNQPYTGHGRTDSHFRREFDISGKLELAYLTINGDDAYSLHLNDVEVVPMGNAGGWRQVEIHDVTALLQPGGNRLDAALTDHGGVTGLIIDLTLRYQDGRVEHIVTDESWQGNVGLTFDPTQNCGSKIVAPFGGGAWLHMPKLSRQTLPNSLRGIFE